MFEIIRQFLILLVAISVVFSYLPVMATPSPTVGRNLTGGATGPCTWFVTLDGTTPVAEAMLGGLSVAPGDNVVGTAGQDPPAFLQTIITIKATIRLRPGTYKTQNSLILASYHPTPHRGITYVNL